jgi:hypothetical protein
MWEGFTQILQNTGGALLVGVPGHMAYRYQREQLSAPAGMDDGAHLRTRKIASTTASNDQRRLTIPSTDCRS